VFQPKTKKETPLEINLLSKVSRFTDLFKLGSKSGECLTTFQFNQNNFYPGETVFITIDCDNTSCSWDVKNYKIKLERKFVGIVRTDKGPISWNRSEYLAYSKHLDPVK
jgi:hypothetical protein